MQNTERNLSLPQNVPTSVRTAENPGTRWVRKGYTNSVFNLEQRRGQKRFLLGICEAKSFVFLETVWGPSKKSTSHVFLFLAALERLQPRSHPGWSGLVCPFPGGFCSAGATHPWLGLGALGWREGAGWGQGQRQGWGGSRKAVLEEFTLQSDSWGAGSCSGSRWDSGKPLHFSSLVIAIVASQYSTGGICKPSIPLIQVQPLLPNNPSSLSSSLYLQIFY